MIKFIQTENTIPTAVLAGGYSSDRQMPAKFICLQPGNVTYVGNAKSVVAMGGSVSFEEISEQLDVDVSGGANIGIFSTSLQAQYARYIQDDIYTSSFYFYTAVQLPTQVWNPNSYGIGVLNSYGAGVYNYDMETFRENCGDKFVQEIHLGAALFATLKVNFNSKYDKTIFTQQSSSSFLGITYASSEIQEVSMKYNLTGVMELSAMQIGGQAGDLAQIFNNTNAGYYISHCQIQDVSACNNLINSILSYSSGNFVSQIDFQNGGVVGNAAPLSYDLGDYTDLGLHATESVITPNITEARASLANAYQESLYMGNRIDHLLNSDSTVIMQFPLPWSQTINVAYSLYWDPSAIDPAIKTKLQLGSNDTNKNVGLLTNPSTGAIDCYYNPNDCAELSNNISSLLSPTLVYNSTLSIFDKAYMYTVITPRLMLGIIPPFNFSIYLMPTDTTTYISIPFFLFPREMSQYTQFVVSYNLSRTDESLSLYLVNNVCDSYPIVSGTNDRMQADEGFVTNCCSNFANQYLDNVLGIIFAMCDSGHDWGRQQCVQPFTPLGCTLTEIDNPII